MGYQVRSLTAISPNDLHAYFVYFVPGHRLSKRWITRWMSREFESIAARIGPQGVIIAPLAAHAAPYIESILGISAEGCLFSSVSRHIGVQHPSFDEDSPTYLLHNGMPFLIVSQSPLAHVDGIRHGTIINLVCCENERELEMVFDRVIDAIRADDIRQLRGILQPSSSATDRHGRRCPTIATADPYLNDALKYVETGLLKDATDISRNHSAKNKWDVFIAYSSRDSEYAHALYDFLCQQHRVFLDRKCIQPGDNWAREIVRAQRSAIISAVLIGPREPEVEFYDIDYYQREEVAIAVALARRGRSSHCVVPVFLPGVSPGSAEVPYGLFQAQGITISSIESVDDAAKQLSQLVDHART